MVCSKGNCNSDTTASTKPAADLFSDLEISQKPLSR